MADSVIESHLANITEKLRVRGAYRRRVVDELRTHLEDATADLEARGLPRDAAARQAVSHLGTPEAVSARFQPPATRTTKILAASGIAGVVIGAGALRAVNELHEDGGRLWSSLPYTAAWLLGWISIALACGPIVAIVLRHRGAPGLVGVLAWPALMMLGVAAMIFHLANDGSVNSGQPSTWRAILVSVTVVVTATIAVVVHRSQLVARWPSVLGTLGGALIAVHYGLLSGHGAAAIAGLALLSTSAGAYAFLLARERALG